MLSAWVVMGLFCPAVSWGEDRPMMLPRFSGWALGSAGIPPPATAPEVLKKSNHLGPTDRARSRAGSQCAQWVAGDVLYKVKLHVTTVFVWLKIQGYVEESWQGTYWQS